MREGWAAKLRVLPPCSPPCLFFKLNIHDYNNKFRMVGGGGLCGRVE